MFFTAKQQQNRTPSQLGTEFSFSALCEGETVNYTYDNKNRLTAISGRANGTTETFTFDALDNLSKYVYTMDSDKDGEVSDGDETIVEETYAYNANRQLASKTVDGKT